MKKKLNFTIFWSKMAQNDGHGTLDISNMQLLFIRTLFLAQMEGSVKWAQNFSIEVPPLLKVYPNEDLMMLFTPGFFLFFCT